MQTLWGRSFGNFQPGDQAQNRTHKEGGSCSPSFNVSNKSQVNFSSDLYTLHQRLWTETGEILGKFWGKVSAPTRGRQKMGELEGKLGTKSGSFLLDWIGQFSAV